MLDSKAAPLGQSEQALMQSLTLVEADLRRIRRIIAQAGNDATGSAQLLAARSKAAELEAKLDRTMMMLLALNPHIDFDSDNEDTSTA